MYDPIVKVDVAVDDTAQLSCSQSSVEHQEVCRRLLIDRFAIGEPFEGFRFDSLRFALLVLRGEVVVLLCHVNQRHRIVRDRTLLIELLKEHFKQ